MDEYITRVEHQEFSKRMEAEHVRAASRIRDLEKEVKEIAELTANVKELATNMTFMLKEQERMSEQLNTLEGRDGEKWRAVITHAITAAVALLVGWMFTHLGF